MKVCKSCRREFGLEFFTKDPRNTDGVGSKCKKCFNERQRQLYPNRKIKRPKGTAQYEYHKQWNRKWGHTFKGWLHVCWTSCKARGKNKGLTITKKDIFNLWEIQGGLCALTGMPMDYTADVRAYNRPSLDRIDSSKGYHIGNVRLVWHFANQAKNTFTDEQFVQFCNNVVEYHRKRK